MNSSWLLFKTVYFIWTDAIEIFLFWNNIEYNISKCGRKQKSFVYCIIKNKTFECNSAIFMLESFHYFIIPFLHGFAGSCYFLFIQDWINGNTSFICFVPKSLTSLIAVLQLRIHYFSKSHVSVPKNFYSNFRSYTGSIWTLSIKCHLRITHHASSYT